jgi:hypothetical protein
MSLVNSSQRTDGQLVSYLLGQLPDEEAQRMDEASIADDEFVSHLRVVEHDLVDAYVSGTLAGEQLRRFESHYLASPRRRENVMFATSFLSAVERAAGAQLHTAHDRTLVFPIDRGDPRRSSSRPVARAPRSKIASGLVAAAAVLVVTCGALLFEVARLRTGLQVSQTESIAQGQRVRDLEQQLSTQTPTQAKTAGRLEGAGDWDAASVSRSSQPPQAVHMTAFVLAPQTRAIGPVPAVAVSPGADSVAFELQLESNDFPRYQVALNDPATNRVEWHSDPIAAPSTGLVPSISVIVPARGLKPHHYSLALVGLGASKSEVVGSYTFQVVRR